MFAVGGQEFGDGGAVDAGNSFENEAGGRHKRAGIAGGYGGLRVAFFNLVDGNAHGGVFFIFQGKLRGFVHADHFGGVEYGNAIHRRVGCGEGLADGGFVADHNEVYVLLLFQKGKGTGDGNCET